MAPLPLIIINKTAAKASITLPFIHKRLEHAGIEYTLCETKAPGDATERVRSAIEDGCQLVGVIGGDGTLSESAAGFFRKSEGLPTLINSQAALAVFPSGTGDDFARTLAGKRVPLDHWVRLFVQYWINPGERKHRVVDIIQVRTNNFRRETICINASTLGLGGETASRVAVQGKSMRRLSGEVRFLAAALGALASWRERPVRIRIDNQIAIEGPMNLIAVANARFAGGGMMLSPSAQLGDGLLDVVTATALSRVEIVRELTRIHRGGHVVNPKVIIAQGTSVVVETINQEDSMLIEVDGNVSGRTPANYQIVPAALKVVAPTQDLQSNT